MLGFKLNYVNKRVSHNQGYYLSLHLGSKLNFFYGPKKTICARKNIDTSVWNQKIAKLSLIFIELYRAILKKPNLTRNFCVADATQC